MKIICLIGSILLLLLLLLSNLVFSQDILLDNDYTKWSNSSSLIVTSSNDFIQAQFKSQQMPMFESGLIYKQLSIEKIPTRISFKFKAFDKIPSAVKIYIHSESSNVWFKNITSTKDWEDIAVHVKFEDWVMGPLNEKSQFEQDIQRIDWVGICIIRNANIESQTYGIDQFIITYCDTQSFFSDIDSDGDGMFNKEEYIAGTDPFDLNSFFMLRMERQENIILYWNSSIGRLYDIFSTTNLFVPFSILKSHIIAEPPYNTYLNIQSDNQRYYKVIVY